MVLASGAGRGAVTVGGRVAFALSQAGVNR